MTKQIRSFWNLAIWIMLIGALLALCVMGGCADDDDDDNDDSGADDDDDDDNDDNAPSFKAGFARVDITPEWSVKLGGYGTYFLSENLCRWSTGSHDPLYATSAAFEDPDGEPMIMIFMDSVGMILPDIQEIRDGITARLSIPNERVVVSASHSHGAPDAVGIWGVWLPPVTGRDEDYIDQMVAKAIEAGVAAWEARVPATLETAHGTEPDLHYNPQDVVDPDAITDDNMNFLAAYDLDGQIIGTIMGWGCHPMVMDGRNTLTTADYPGAYYRIMDEEVGGINMYLNSSLGATVHPINLEYGFEITGNTWGTWEDVDNFGRVLADDAQALLAQGAPLQSYKIHAHSRTIYGHMENPLFALVGSLGIIPRQIPELGGYGVSAMTAFSIGDLKFGTVPGELVPDIGLELREIMGGDENFVITLSMDWLGYIMTAEQYRSLLYFYFSILSVGPETGGMIVSEYEDVFSNWPEN